MIPRVDIESIPYLITFTVVLMYVYVLRGYTVKRRFVEWVMLLLTFISLLIPFSYSLIQMLEFNIEYSFVFLYSHSSATLYERISSMLYSLSGDVFLVFAAFFLLILRFKVGHSLYRVGVRESVNGYLLSIAALAMVYIFYPPYEIYDTVLAGDGRGVYPTWTLPYSDLVVLLFYLSISLILMGSSLYLYMWRERILGLDEFARRSLFLGAALLTFIVFIRFLYSNIVFGRERFINLTTFDISLIILLVSSLLFYEVYLISRTRIIGAMAVSSYLTVFSSLLAVEALNPETALPLRNVLNTGEYVFLIFTTLVLTSLVISREIFRRSFFPWFSEDIEFLTRAGSSVILLALQLSMLVSLFNLSIYYTFGQEVVRVSTDFIVSILFYLSTFTFMSVTGEILARRYQNINHVIFTVFGLYALLGGGYNYNLWFIREYLYVYPILAIPLVVYLFYKYKKIPVVRLILLFVFFHLLASQIWFGGGPIKSIGFEDSLEFNGYTLSNPVFNITNSDINVYNEITSNTTYLYYSHEYVIFEEGYQLDRYVFEALELRFPVGKFVWDIASYKMYILGLVRGSSDGVSVFIADVYWLPINYFLLPALVIIAVYLSKRFEYY